MSATLAGSLDAVQFLLHRFPSQFGLRRHSRPDGTTLIQLAARYAQYRVLELLLPKLDTRSPSLCDSSKAASQHIILQLVLLEHVNYWNKIEETNAFISSKRWMEMLLMAAALAGYEHFLSIWLDHFIAYCGITFGMDFNQPLGDSLNALTNLQTLTFGIKFNQPLGESLNALTNLTTLTHNHRPLVERRTH